ncbi:MAG: hypothetical protein SchgKO_11830 [Schleiferiaceae bacterium]
MDEKAYSFSNNFPILSQIPYPEQHKVYGAPHHWTIDPKPYVGIDFLIGNYSGQDIRFALCFGYRVSNRVQYSHQTYTSDMSQIDIYLNRKELREEFGLGIQNIFNNKIGFSFDLIIYKSAIEIPRFELIERPKSAKTKFHSLDKSVLFSEYRGVSLEIGIDYYIHKNMAVSFKYQPNYVTVGKSYPSFIAGGASYDRKGFWAHNFHLGIVIPIWVTSFNGGPESQK